MSEIKSPATPLHQPILFNALPSVFLWFGLPIYGKSLGADALAIGGLYSVVAATMVVLRPVVGWGLDRFGRKRFFVTALVFTAIAMSVFAFARNLAGLYLARSLQGIAGAVMGVSVNTIVADLTGEAGRGQAMGRVNELEARGGIFGGFIG